MEHSYTVYTNNVKASLLQFIVAYCVVVDQQFLNRYRHHWNCCSSTSIVTIDTLAIRSLSPGLMLITVLVAGDSNNNIKWTDWSVGWLVGSFVCLQNHVPFLLVFISFLLFLVWFVAHFLLLCWVITTTTFTIFYVDVCFSYSFYFILFFCMFYISFFVTFFITFSVVVLVVAA